MILRPRPERVLNLLEREAEILEIMREGVACSSMQVDARLKNSNLLETMRIIHAMEAKGLLERVNANGRKLFRLKNNIQKVRIVRRKLNHH
ncbi:MAG TPA: hypothetical protein VGD65_19515 [Chryseosolibacter sp.]